jgi:hypothetical protein
MGTLGITLGADTAERLMSPNRVVSRVNSRKCV